MRHIPDEILYDSRLLERHIAAGHISRKDVEARLAKLADATDLGERVEIGEPTGTSAALPEPEQSAT